MDCFATNVVMDFLLERRFCLHTHFHHGFSRQNAELDSYVRTVNDLLEK